MINVVGIGPGKNDLISVSGKNIILDSEIIIGGKRNIENTKLFLENKNIIYYHITSNLDEMKEFIQNNIEKRITVLASGDPSIYGISDFIIRNFNENTEVNILPGISSIQYAFSKFKINMNEVFITSFHGREADYTKIIKHDKVVVLTDNKNKANIIAENLINLGYDYMMYVGENLSSQEEKLTKAMCSEIKDMEFSSLSVVILIKI